MALETKDIWSLTLGCIGTVLGVLNFVRGLLKDRVKLKVIPKIYRQCADHARITMDDNANLDAPWEGLCIEVINVGSVAASVDQIGFETNDPELPRLVNPKIMFSDNSVKLPHKLEPKTKLLALWPTPPLAFKLGLYNIKSAFVITSCDKMFKGNSPIVERLIGIGKRTQFRLQPVVSAPD